MDVEIGIRNDWKYFNTGQGGICRLRWNRPGRTKHRTWAETELAGPDRVRKFVGAPFNLRLSAQQDTLPLTV